MGSTLTDEGIRELRKTAHSAEPYPYDHEIFHMLDIEYTPAEEERVWATLAKKALEMAGVPLEESGDADAPG